MTELNIKHVKTATAIPRSNGQVERVNRFLRSVLAKLSVDESWINVLTKAQFSLNNTIKQLILLQIYSCLDMNNVDLTKT